MSADVYSVIRDGKYSCPVCQARSHTLADKKAHIRTEHPKVKR